MKQGAFLRIGIVVIGLLISFANAVDAATHYIYVSSSGFQPNQKSIGAGDTVVWVNDEDDFHTTTSDKPFGHADYWRGFLIDYDDTYSHTFHNTGTFTYRDEFTARTGTIVVGASTPNPPPSVSITSPMNEATLAAPATFSFNVDATDANGISWVEFYLNGELIDFLFSGPFSTTVMNLAEGTYILSAQATDGLGAQSSTSIIIVVDGSVPLTPATLSAPRIESGQFVFDVSGLISGKSNWLQRSTNMIHWTTIKTNMASGTSDTITTPMNGAAACYRVVQLP